MRPTLPLSRAGGDRSVIRASWYGGAYTFAQAIKGNYDILNSPDLYGVPPQYDGHSFTNNSFHRYLIQPDQDPDQTDVSAAILCLDSPLPSLSVKQIQEHVFKSENTGIVGGPDNTADTICSCWPFKANDQYCGPWALSEGRCKPASVSSSFWSRPAERLYSHPILIIANSYDPYTSIDGAKAVAAALGSSARLLVEDGFGHTSFSQQSTCIYNYLGKYLLTGILPPKNTVCQADANPFILSYEDSQ